jgi:DNA-binding GntR family transcriptional regulator
MLDNLAVNRVVTLSKAEAARQELRRLILRDELPGNTVLNQEQIAAQLGVSTTPLREALRMLESEGLVTNRGHGHVVVTEVDASELPDLYVVKEELDCLAASEAARRAQPGDLEAMRAALAVQSSPDLTHADEWAINAAFHRTIIRATHNDILIEQLARLYEQYARHKRLFTEVVFFDETAQREHASMVTAIEERRARDAAAHMRAHYARGRDTISLERATPLP